MKKDGSYKEELSASDADFIRVLEDLIDVLISNGTIRMTDLPPEALQKLHARKQTRQRLRNTSLDLINDDDGLL